MSRTPFLHLLAPNPPPLTAAALLSGIYPLRYRPCPRNSWISIRLFLLFPFFFFFFFNSLSPSPPSSLAVSPFFLSLFFIRSPSPQRGSKVRSLTVRRRSRRLMFQRFRYFRFKSFHRSIVAAIRSSRAFFLFTTLPSSTLAPATPDYASHFFLSLSFSRGVSSSASGGPLSSCRENFLTQHE